ncbi:hypothetical protein [Pseudonocardia endophytica]|uniref:Uncharacterized protein n=1 Tax=Pseudonocardia endophytica TaxID=401976 RepID=A0A4R1HWY8_PSEEN|nr:hypothetical protein [Pseudonocardia endophytica]TCK26868.1 hypothetical protein EV378_2713 [Pseudonocardia endophytica]
MTATERTGQVDRAGRGRVKAAWVLVVLAPLCAEAAFSGISLPAIWVALPLLVPMYGAGVLLVRELVVRAGAGWPGLLVLGVAYEIAEDGFGLQALTSPHLYTAAEWGPRVLGFNTTYWQSQIGYHLVFSVLIPVMLADLLFRRHAGRPYLRAGGTVVAALVFLVGVALVRFGISGIEDPGYRTPWPAVVVELLLVVVLAVVALVVLPRVRLPRPAPLRRLPHPAVLVSVAAVAPIVVHGLLFPLWSDAGRPALGDAVPTVVPMVVALVLAVGVGWLVVRWSVTDGFGDRQRILLIGGAMVGHSLFAVASGLAAGQVVVSPVIGVVVIAVTVFGLVRLDRRVRLQEPAG